MGVGGGIAKGGGVWGAVGLADKCVLGTGGGLRGASVGVGGRGGRGKGVR